MAEQVKFKTRDGRIVSFRAGNRRQARRQPSRSEYRHEDVAEAPRGWRVRTVEAGEKHQVRVAFPPGPRRKGAGRLISILHPKGENPACNRHRLNPVLQAALAGAAAGAAGEFLRNIRSNVYARASYLAGEREIKPRPGEWAVTYDQKTWIVPGTRAELEDWAESVFGGRGPFRLDRTARGLAVEYADLNELMSGVDDNDPDWDDKFESRLKAWRRESNRNAAQGGSERRKASPNARAAGVATPKRFAGVAATQRSPQRAATLSTSQLGRKSRTNQGGDGSAVEAYEEFHGRGPQEILELEEKLLRSGDYWSLGKLTGLWLSPLPKDVNDWPTPEIEADPNDDKIFVAAEPDGQQLYLVGGEQKLSAADLRALRAVADTSKRFIVLGCVYGIGYTTEKQFDNFKTADYRHQFGEETGERPLAYYDQEAGRIVLVGGAYKIAPPEGSMRMSPGIVN